MIHSTVRLVLIITRGRHLKRKFQDMTLIFVAHDIICFVSGFVKDMSLFVVVHIIIFPGKDGCYDQSCYDHMIT